MRVCGEQTKTLATVALCQINSEYPGKASTLAQIKYLAFTRLVWKLMGERFEHLLSSHVLTRHTKYLYRSLGIQE